jgi:hypothetical protein
LKVSISHTLLVFMRELMSRLERVPMPSNIFSNPSSSELSSARSESNNLGGVAVLALLAVMARLRVLSKEGCIAGTGGRSGVEVTESFDDFIPIPREKVRAELRRNPGRAEAGGGAGTSLIGGIMRSDRESRDEGLVEVLSLVEDAALC